MLAKKLFMLPAKLWGMPGNVLLILLSVFTEVLNYKCGVSFFFSKQPAEAVFYKSSGLHYGGYVLLLHPLKPVLRFGSRYFYSYVIKQHRSIQGIAAQQAESFPGFHHIYAAGITG